MDDIKKRIIQKAQLFNLLFKTEDGQKVLAALDEEFNGEDLMADDPYRTHYNLGARDVVMYINQMIRVGERNG